jgi:hypothetical protein
MLNGGMVSGASRASFARVGDVADQKSDVMRRSPENPKRLYDI